MNPDVAYLTGVLQTDGCINVFHDKKRHKTVHRMLICGGEKSLPMLERSREILENQFGRKLKIQKRIQNTNFKDNAIRYDVVASINKLLPSLKRLGLEQKPFVPGWIFQEPRLFGAYLAGFIDGDGNIRIKRKAYPQCAVTLFGGKIPEKLVSAIRKSLNCATYMRSRDGRNEQVEFYVSKKNVEFIRKYVYPYVTIRHKKIVLDKFFQLKGVVV